MVRINNLYIPTLAVLTLNTGGYESQVTNALLQIRPELQEIIRTPMWALPLIDCVWPCKDSPIGDNLAEQQHGYDAN